MDLDRKFIFGAGNINWTYRESTVDFIVLVRYTLVHL